MALTWTCVSLSTTSIHKSEYMQSRDVDESWTNRWTIWKSQSEHLKEVNFKHRFRDFRPCFLTRSDRGTCDIWLTLLYFFPSLSQPRKQLWPDSTWTSDLPGCPLLPNTLPMDPLGFAVWGSSWGPLPRLLSHPIHFQLDWDLGILARSKPLAFFSGSLSIS